MAQEAAGLLAAGGVGDIGADATVVIRGQRLEHDFGWWFGPWRAPFHSSAGRASGGLDFPRAAAQSGAAHTRSRAFRGRQTDEERPWPRFP
jgi:hypothetical protein